MLLLQTNCFCFVNSNNFQRPKTLNVQGKVAVVSVASALSTFGLYSAYRFNEDEQIINTFKTNTFEKYIAPKMNVLEVGFGEGSGSNLPYYPQDITLTGIDPYTIQYKSVPAVVKKYKISKNISLNLKNSYCENLPFPSASFDVVISTLVMCSVKDPAKCLFEISRVLKPGGVFICQEHIHAEMGSPLAFQQEMFDPLQQALANGCHLTRETNLLLASLVFDTGNSNAKSITAFSKIMEQRTVLLSSHWPISRQYLAVFQK